MTEIEAIKYLQWYFDDDDGTGADPTVKKAVLIAIEAILKIEVIQEVIDMPFEWEQDDRKRYARIVDIVRKDLTQDGTT